MEGEIRLEELVKAFGPDVVAVDGIDLHMPPGEFFTLVGPSGCGKTTTLRMIAGFESPTEGSIRIAGQDVTHLRPNQRKIGMVFQSYALFPNMTVADNIGFGLCVRRTPRDKIKRKAQELLELINMPDKGRYRPPSLPGEFRDPHLIVDQLEQLIQHDVGRHVTALFEASRGGLQRAASALATAI